MTTFSALQDVAISRYEGAQSKWGIQVSLIEELKKIKEETYKDKINECRRVLLQEGKVKYTAVKKQLPALTFCGTFDGPHSKDRLINFNPILIIDVDDLLPEEVEEKKDLLFKDDHIFASWISPSGVGIKALMRTNATAEIHKFYFDFAVRYFNDKYQIPVDVSGSDVSRLCFVSYDPYLLQKDRSKIFEISEDDISALLKESAGKRTIKDSATKSINSSKEFISSISIRDIESVLFHKTEGRNNRSDRELISKIIKFLSKKTLSITSTYNEWYRVAIAIANTFTYDIGEKYFLKLCRLDGANHNEYKSRYILEYCYRNRRANQIGFATIIYLAQQQGFKLKLKTRSIFKPKKETPS